MGEKLEKTIEFFSPSWAAKRQVAKLSLEQMRKYDGASRGRRTANWYAPSTSASNETAQALTTLRNRMRDQVRNNPWASKAVNVVVANTVGEGIRGTVRGRSSGRSKALQDLWQLWAETGMCDATGRHNLYGLQQLAMRTIVESGEVLIIKEVRRGQRVPVMLRVIEPDHLDTSKDAQQIGGNRVMEGIEYDATGRPVAYYVFPEHPGDRVSYRDGQRDSVRVPADNVIHVFRQDRPGQNRGVPWGASIMVRLKDLDDYEDAQLLRQKIAACFSAFVTDIDGVQNGQQLSISDKIEPGSIEILPPGRSIQFATPPAAQGYSEYMRSMLHSIASGFGITYESLTGDLSQVNFSSARMGWLEFQRNLDQWRWNMLIPQMLGRVWEWFQQGAVLTGADADLATMEWTAPRREMIDPGKEIAAMRDAVRAGFCSLSEAQRMLGYDPAKLLEEYKSDANKLDELGLVFDTDPRKMTQQGQAQPPEESADPQDDLTDDALRELLRSFAHAK